MAITRTDRAAIPVPGYLDSYHVQLSDWLAALDGSPAIGPLAVTPVARGETTLLPSGSLAVRVGAGPYRGAGGAELSYGGAASFALPDDATKVLYLDGSGVLQHGDDWPVGRHTRLAVATTAGGVVTAIEDARVAFGQSGLPVAGAQHYAGTADSAALANTASAGSLMPAAAAGSATLAAADLADGATIRATGWLVASATGTPTLTLTLTVSGVGSVAVPLTAASWSSTAVRFEALVAIRAIGDPGGARLSMYAQAGGAAACARAAPGSPDTTGDLTVTLTGQWSAADPANTATLEGLVVELLRG